MKRNQMTNGKILKAKLARERKKNQQKLYEKKKTLATVYYSFRMT